MKKYLLLLMCLIASVGVQAQTRGTCGDNLTWSLEDGILVTSGTGAMTNYTSSSRAPWYSSRSSISVAIISEGVTSIGNSAFSDCSGLTSISIGNSVTSIGEFAFFGCSGLTSVTIPNSVTSIGSYAFSGCSGLTSITIGNSVMSIGNSAFRGCSGLTSITIPNSVTSIGSGAFYNCSGLTSITIPNSVTSIGNYAFYNCSGLTSITIPNSVTSIGEYAFYDCSSLTSVNITDLASWCNIDFDSGTANPTFYAHKLVLNGKEIKDLVIPEGVTAIKNYAFSGCSGLTSITIPNSVTSIGRHVFSGCSGLTSINVSESNDYYCSVDGILFNKDRSSIISFPGGKSGEYIIPNSVTSIGDRAFWDCSDLTSVTIPNSVTSIGDYAFYGCSGLTSVTIPNSVTSIGNYAFQGCSGLTSITIPNSVKRIGERAFWDCSGLTSVRVLATTPPTCGYDLLYNAGTNTIHVYEGLADLYETASGWESYYIVDDIPGVHVTGLTLDATRYLCGIGQRFTPQVVAYEPEDATYKQVTWSSSDPSTLTIVANTGGCIGLKDGIVTITATAKDADRATTTATVYVGNVYPEDAVTISVSSSNEAMGTVSGGGTFLPGATVTLTATPASRGFEFQSWSDGSTDNPYSFTATENKELVANFVQKPKHYIKHVKSGLFLKFDPTAHEDAKVNVLSLANEGSAFVIESTANGTSFYCDEVGKYLYTSGAYFWNPSYSTMPSYWQVEETTDGYYIKKNSSSYCAPDGTTVGEYVYTNKEVDNVNGTVFEFIPVIPPSEFEISASCNAEHGTVTGSGTYEKDTEVTLTAVPAKGYKFIRWSDGSTENPYTFLATKDKTLTAEFKLIQRTLTDGTAYANSAEETYDYVNYTRTFDDTEWQALYVPFSMSYEDWADDFEVAKINMFHQYDTDDDGNFDKLELEIIKVKSGTLKANHPYLIKALRPGEKTITLENATLYPAEENSLNCSSVETAYTFTGTYAGISGAEMYDNRYYSMENGSLIYAEDPVAELTPYRWYLKITDREGQVINAPANIRVMEWGNSVVTDIDHIALEGESAATYRIDGRRVQNIRTKGLYIQGGRKIMTH